MEFSDTDAIAQLEAMTPEQYDELPFGVIAMAPSGIVESYNRYEAEVAGLDPQRVIGKHFFRDIAPCTNNHLVAGLYDLQENVDQTLPYLFTLRMKPTHVTLRALKAPSAQRQYLLVERAE